MSARLKIGVIGLGRMGQLYARTLASQVSGVHLYAIADVEEQVRSALAGEFSIPHAFADIHELITLPDLDAVVITTPTRTHPELVIATARAGKAIFCEKPLALTLEETRTVLDAVAQANVPLQVGFMRRFDAAYQRAKTLIAEGRIGRPVTFKSIGRDPFCPRPEYADPAQSGGLIIDMAIHDFDLARWLMGSEVERVSAEGTLLVCEQLEQVGDIDNAVINLRFANNALGNVEVSRNAFYGYEIGCILKGTGIIAMGQRVYPYVAGQIYIINDLEPHRYYSGDEGSQLLVVHFHPGLLESRWGGQMQREVRVPLVSQFGQHGPLIPPDAPLTAPIRTLLEALREEALRRRPLWDVIASGLLLQAVGLLRRQMTQAIEYSPEELQRRRALKRIQPILELLQTRYTEGLSLDELASAGCMSSSYCCELFQVALGTTPIAYRNGLRLTEARRLMQTTDLTVHDIAYRVGFQSVQQFNRLFRRDIGCSPSHFRMLLQL